MINHFQDLIEFIQQHEILVNCLYVLSISAISSTFQWIMIEIIIPNWEQFTSRFHWMNCNHYSVDDFFVFSLKFTNFVVISAAVSFIWKLQLYNNPLWSNPFNESAFPCAWYSNAINKIDWMLTFYRWVKYAFCLNCEFHPKKFHRMCFYPNACMRISFQIQMLPCNWCNIIEIAMQWFFSRFVVFTFAFALLIKQFILCRHNPKTSFVFGWHSNLYW